MTYKFIPPDLPLGGSGGSGLDFTGKTDGLPIAAGDIGETLSASNGLSSTNVGATNVFGYAVDLTVSPGIWVISAVVQFDQNSSEINFPIIAGIGTSAVGGGVGSTNELRIPFNIAGEEITMPIPDLLINITTPTTYYLNTRFTYTDGTPLHGGTLLARRYR